MLIKNARDYEGRICDYLIADGKIRAIGTDLPEAGEDQCKRADHSACVY